MPEGWPTALFTRRARRHALPGGTELATIVNAMSQAEGFYLCLSVCICGLIDGAVDEAGGGEARKLASCRLQVGDPNLTDYKSAVPGTLLNWETLMRASLTECKSVVPPCSRWVMVGCGV